MIRRRVLDTNFVIRVLVRDNEKQVKIAEKLFDACERGEAALIMLPIVLAECVFVLESFYGRSRGDIIAALQGFIIAPGIEMADVGLYSDALRRYGLTNLHFVDCVIAAFAAEKNVPVSSFDAGFRSQKDVKVELD